MQWDKLQHNMCPYCLAKMEFDRDLQVINCTACRFNISPARFKLIVENRSNIRNKITLKWQNLIDDRCPQCGEDLIDGVMKQDMRMLVCSTTPSCTFRLGRDKYDMIMNDPLHPAHQYKND